MSSVLPVLFVPSVLNAYVIFRDFIFVSLDLCVLTRRVRQLGACVCIDACRCVSICIYLPVDACRCVLMRVDVCLFAWRCVSMCFGVCRCVSMCVMCVDSYRFVHRFVSICSSIRVHLLVDSYRLTRLFVSICPSIRVDLPVDFRAVFLSFVNQISIN